MALEGKRINQLAVAATTIEDDDLFGIDKDLGAGSFQTVKAKRKLLPRINVVNRTTDLLRTPAAGFIDDPELVFAVKIGVRYVIQSRLYWVPGGGAATIQRAWQVPALTSGFLDALVFQSITGWTHSYSSGLFLAESSNAGNEMVIEDRLIIVPSAAGNVAVRWGSAITGATIKAGSFAQFQAFPP